MIKIFVGKVWKDFDSLGIKMGKSKFILRVCLWGVSIYRPLSLKRRENPTRAV